ncbi:MAG: SpoIIE family protein phosphatase [Lachnospiraceae bacterium]|nr:SpoIIE family protein phosphatase [Lachnospiraceae bacterium]
MKKTKIEKQPLPEGTHSAPSSDGDNIKNSLRRKIFRMNILLVAAAVILFAIAGILQMNRFARLMEDTSLEENTVIMETTSESMREMATESFQKYVVAQAKVVDGEFWTMRHDLEILARQVQMVLEYPDAFSPLEVPLPSEADAGKLSLQLLYSENADREDPALKEQILRIGGLRNMILEIVEGGDTLMDCMVSLPGGASIIADRTPESKMNEDGKILPYNADRRPWYVGALVHEETYFTPVNMDNYFTNYEVMAGVPVYVDGELAAVCGGSVNMEDLDDIVAKVQIGDQSDTCLINENGNVLYSSRESGELALSTNELRSLKESSNAELVALVNKALEGGSGFSLVNVDGEKLYIAYAPLPTIGWTQLLTISQEDLNSTAYRLMEETGAVKQKSLARSRRNARTMTMITLLIAMGLIAMAVVMSMMFADRLVKPIKRMTMRVSRMHGDDMSFEVEDVYLTKDEIEVLARAFSNMSQKMRGYVHEIVNITAEKQRLDTELSVASEIQVNMLPNHFPAFPDRREFDLYAVMDPAKEVGGDFYDFFLIDDDHLALVMADVSGKGVPAALFMVISKTLIKNITLSGSKSGPGEILSDVNDRLCEGNEDSMFVTVWLGILTISTGQLVSACAGHEYPVFYRRGDGFKMEKEAHGLALGAMEGVRFREAHWQMNPGDLLFLYTDGVPEATDASMTLFGNDRMLQALSESLEEEMLQSPQAGSAGRGWDYDELHSFLTLVRRHVDEFVGEAPQFDDLTMMCFSYKGTPETEEEK